MTLGQSAEGVETKHHLGNVPSLVKVGGLKQLLGGDSIIPGRTQEGLDILHEHERSALKLKHEVLDVKDNVTVSRNFLMLPGWILFMRRHRIVPSLRTISKSPVGSFSSKTDPIH